MLSEIHDASYIVKAWNDFNSYLKRHPEIWQSLADKLWDGFTDYKNIPFGDKEIWYEKRIDNIVNELTNCIEEQIQTEVETALGVKHRKDVGVPMFSSLCFICKDGGSASILVNYLQNNMGFNLTYKECSWYSLTSKSNERIHVWTIGDFEKMRCYKYQAIFIQKDIYDHALADKVSVHALWVNELIPPMEPWVFRLPNPMVNIKTKPLSTKTVFEER